MQLLGLLPWSHRFEDEKGLKAFKFMLTTREEEVLKKLTQKYPQPVKVGYRGSMHHTILEHKSTADAVLRCGYF